ncbi:MAG: hypothetical protein ACI4RI_02070 [Ruminococcus sp.]
MKKVITFIIIIAMIMFLLTSCKNEKPTDISNKAYKYATDVISSTATYYDGLNSSSGTLLLMEDDYDNFMNSTDGSATYTEVMFKFIYMKQAVEKDNREDFRKMYDEVKEILAIEE